VVFLVVSLLVWLVAALFDRHYKKIRGARGNVPSEQPAWWVRIGDVSHSVPDIATLRAWAGERRFGRDDLVWEPSASRWIAASDVEELRSEFYPPFVIKWRYDVVRKVWPLYFVLLAGIGVVTIIGSFDLGLVSAVPALWWQTAGGTVVRSAVSQEDIGPTGYPVIRYRPAIEYQYRVAGRTYTAMRRDFAQHADGDRYAYRERAEAIAAAFPLNERVTVYFDPDEPAHATLERSEGTVIAFVMGGLMVAIAIFVLRAWWRRHAASVAAGVPTQSPFESSSSPR
jgi:hypothetical protein